MTKTNYLMGMCPLFIGMEVRLSCVVQEPLLTREVPGIVRRIALHPKEVIPPDVGASAVHILKYQPLGVLAHFICVRLQAPHGDNGSAFFF